MKARAAIQDLLIYKYSSAGGTGVLVRDFQNYMYAIIIIIIIIIRTKIRFT